MQFRLLNKKTGRRRTRTLENVYNDKRTMIKQNHDHQTESRNAKGNNKCGHTRITTHWKKKQQIQIMF